jgi:hypothetical protein
VPVEPLPEPSSLVGPQQECQAGGRRDDRDQADAAGDGGDRHAVEDEQAEAGQRGLAARDRHEVDDHGDDGDEDHRQRDEPGQGQGRRGLFPYLPGAVGQHRPEAGQALPRR